VPGKLNSHGQNNEIKSVAYIINKSNSKQIKGLNKRPETIEHLEGTTEKFIYIGLGHDFLDMISNTQTTKAKITGGTISN
jgi:hypothetical protein